MKIGQITRYYFPFDGGQQTYIRNLIGVFTKNNITSTIFQPYAPGASKIEHIIVTSPIPFLRRLDRYIQNISWFIFNFQLRWVKKKIASQDIIISHYSFHYAAIRWHKKVIILSHGILWSSKLQTIFDKFLHRKDLTLRKKQNVFVVANDTDFIRRIGVDVPEGKGHFTEVNKNMWFIPNCIDDSFFCPDPNTIKEKLLLVPRNIRPDRGIDLVIRAFIIFSEQYPDYKLKIIGGPLKGRYFQYCSNLVATYKMSAKISFEGSIEWKSMRDQYRRAAITIIPSLEKEGTSLSALESMGCGTAVVGTNVAGLRDLPIIKADPSPEALAQKLIDTLNDLDAITAHQHKNIETTFNLRNWEKAWLEVVSRVYNSESQH